MENLWTFSIHRVLLVKLVQPGLLVGMVLRYFKHMIFCDGLTTEYVLIKAGFCRKCKGRGRFLEEVLLCLLLYIICNYYITRNNI